MLGNAGGGGNPVLGAIWQGMTLCRVLETIRGGSDTTQGAGNHRRRG